MDQVLLLWDRIVGYDNLEIIAVFAAALFTYRSTKIIELVKVQSDDTREKVMALLSENSEIKVIPVLQQCLFSNYIENCNRMEQP